MNLTQGVIKMKYLIIITVVLLGGCATFESDVKNMHIMAKQCNGVSTIQATETDKSSTLSYICSQEHVQL